MNVRILLAMISVLGLLIAACEVDDDAAAPDTDDTPTPEQTPDEEPDVDDADEAALDDLIAAVENTRDEGSARFFVSFGDDPGAETPGTAEDDGLTDDDATDENGVTDNDNGITDDDDNGITDDDATDPDADREPTDPHATLEVEGLVDFDAQQRELQFDGPEGQVTAIIDGDDLYVRIPAGEQGDWKHVELDELAGAHAARGPGALLLQDPHLTLEMLEDAAVEVRQTDHTRHDDADGIDDDNGLTNGDDNGLTDNDNGLTDNDNGLTDNDNGLTNGDDNGLTNGDDNSLTEETDRDGALDGSATGEPHFVVLLDLERVDDEHVRTFADDLGVTEIEMEVWVDAEDRVEQVQYSLPTDDAPQNGNDVTDDNGLTDNDNGLTNGDDNGVTDNDNGITDNDVTDDGTADADPARDLTVTIHYTDFGIDVDIETPDEGDVVELDEDELRRALGTPEESPAETDDDVGMED